MRRDEAAIPVRRAGVRVNRLRALAFLPLATLAGCTYVHGVGSLPSDVAGKRVTVQTWRGDRISARASPTPTGLVWRTDQGAEIDARDVAVVETVSHGRGLLEGLGVGLLFGVGGAALGWLSGDDRGCGGEWICIRFTAGEKALIFGAALGIPGVAIGGVVGLARGRRDVYVIAGEGGARLTLVPVPHGAAARLSWSF